MTNSIAAATGAPAGGVSRPGSLLLTAPDAGGDAPKGSAAPVSQPPSSGAVALAVPSASAASSSLPAYLTQPYPIVPFGPLRSDPSHYPVLGVSPLIGASEIDPTYCFRPTHIHSGSSLGGGGGGGSWGGQNKNSISTAFHLKEIAGTEGGRSVVAVPSLAQVWRPRVQQILESTISKPTPSILASIAAAPEGLSRGEVIDHLIGSELHGGSPHRLPALQTKLSAADVHADDDPVRRDVDRAEHHARLHQQFVVPTIALAQSLFDSDATALGITGFTAPPALLQPDNTLVSAPPTTAGTDKSSARAPNRKATTTATATAGAANSDASATVTGAVSPVPITPAAAAGVSAAARKRPGAKEKEAEAAAAAAAAASPQPVRIIRHTVEQSDGAAQIEAAIAAQRRALCYALTQRIEHVNSQTNNFRLLLRPVIGLRDPANWLNRSASLNALAPAAR